MLEINEIEVRNLRLRYLDTGEPAGQPAQPILLLIHGYPLNLEMWAPQIAGLSDVARVIAPSLRGHAGSQGTEGPYFMELFAGDLLALLDELHITRPVVVCGLSMGGYVAMAFLRQNASRVAGLILAATRAGDENEQQRAGRDQAAATAREKGMQAVVEGVLPKMLAPQNFESKPELVELVRKIMLTIPVETAVADLMGMKVRPDSFATLQQTHVPALVLHGANDQIFPTQEAEKTHAALPGSQLEIIQDAGHLLNLEQPEEFNRLVRSFLQTIRAQKA